MELATSAMGSLLGKLGKLLEEEYKLQKGVMEQVRSLSRELEIMHVTLHKVAEVPREQLDELVKLWAHDVRELSYDMEDVIDTFLVRVEYGREATPNPHKLKMLVKMDNLFRKGKAFHQIAIAIQDINKQIQEVAHRYGRYMAHSTVAMLAASTSISPRLQALNREARENKLPTDQTMECVTGAMGSLLPKLGELLKEYKLQKGIRAQVQSLNRELETMHAALCNVAKVPHEQLDEQVKLWARDIRELSYNIENIVNTFMVRIEDGREATPNPHRLKKLVKKMGNLFNKVKARYQIAIAIEDINKQIQEVAHRHGRYMAHRTMAMPAALTSIDPCLQVLHREARESKLPIDRTMEFVTGAMCSLLPKLGKMLKEEYKLQKGIRAQVQSLSRERETMHAALRNVAEVPHEQLDEQVKLWARYVRELSYNIENIVNTFMVHIEDVREATPNPHRLRKLVKKMGNLFNKVKARYQIAIAIKDINKQIQEVAHRHGRYMVHSTVAMPAASTSITPRLQALNRKARENELPIDRTMECVTGAMGSLLPKLGELLKEKYKLQKGIRAQVQSLNREVETMHAALCNVAKVPHEQLDEQVKLWARDVRELSYNIENIVNTFMVRIEDGCEAMPNPHRLKKLVKKMGNLFSKVKARYQIAIAIKDINNQIQEVAHRHGRYMAHSTVAMPAASTSIAPRLQALHREARESKLPIDQTMECVTGAMGNLLPKLGELLKEEYKLQKGIRAQVQSLSKELETMHAALRNVAEVPHEQLDEQVKLWAHDVRELLYNIENIVNTFMVHIEDGREATPNPHRLKKLVKKISNLFNKVKARYQITIAIQDINKQIQEVAHRRGRYTTHSTMATPVASTSIDPRLQANREAAELTGINEKKDRELIKMLSEGDDVSKKKLKIVSVVGFGGLGKTTLVRAVYDKIKGDFDCSAFIPVGRNVDVKNVLMDILLHLDTQRYTNNVEVFDEKKLIDEIREFLENKRYLIIIDDIWDEELWGVIKCAFPDRNNLGSRLITTTRKVSVSQACCSSSDDKVYKMEPLSDDDSQRLFYQRIFSDRSGCPPELEQVSKDILKKCGGVPLAIITIASLLASSKQTKDEWYTLLNSIGRGLTEHACVEEMQRILSFSYYNLPSHLKTCLLYLSVFPEDYEIASAPLIWRWIAEGFVRPREQGTSLFEVGESYLNELVNRSMIQPADIDAKGSVRSCRVHDMVLNLICALSSEENFVTILDGTRQSTPNSQSKVHRLSLQNSKVDETTPLVSVSQVRSITVFPPAINLMPHLSSIDVLRVLDLYGCYLGESSPVNLRHVGNLFHLRYLGLADTHIRELPAEIGKLRFLQVLDVRHNVVLRELPPTVVKLRTLMCLLLVNHIRLPNGMGNLTSMEVLRWISTEGCPNIVKELRFLTRLRELKIYFPRDENLELEEAFVHSLCNLHSVQRLAIRGYFRSMDLLGERWVPPQHLRSFSTRMFDGLFSTLPAWVKRDPSLLSDLSELRIHVKEVRQEDLQILGRLPALRSLYIQSTHQTQRLLLIGADWFRCVILFCVVCKPTGHLMFQPGALPTAQMVYFPFDIQMAKDDGNGDFDLGLGNLLSLREVSVIVHSEGATFGEVEEAEAALRHAVDAHPNHPTIHIGMVPHIPEAQRNPNHP